MINFPCHCGHTFSVGDDLAGGLVQCPNCKRLKDVPLLSDLQNIDDGGIYKIDAPPKPIQNPQDRINELTYTFTREHYDAHGTPIDLRGVAGDPNTDLVPVESLGPLESAAPKYDPVTGELIQQFDVKPDPKPNPATLPTARRAKFKPPTSVDGIDIPKPFESLTIPVRLFKPANFLVMLFIFFAHVFGMMMMTAIGSFYIVLWPGWMILHGLIIAHYGNVIDETGPSSKDELPTPLRNLAWHEDTFGSFTRVVIALLVCYGPAAIVLYNATPSAIVVVRIISAALAIIGTLLFPAALLTSTTSGSLLNLRPDRLVGVALICGMEYWMALVLWIIGGGLWLGATAVTNAFSAELLALRGRSFAPILWLGAFVSLIIGVYVLHIFCWHLGIMYRRNHQRFPWLFQRHHSKRGGIEQSKGFPVGRPVRVAPPSPPTKNAPRVEQIRPGQKTS